MDRKKSLPLFPDWSGLMQMRTPNPCGLISPKNTLLIGQDGATLVSKDAGRNIPIQLSLDGENLSPIG